MQLTDVATSLSLHGMALMRVGLRECRAAAMQLVYVNIARLGLALIIDLVYMRTPHRYGRRVWCLRMVLSCLIRCIASRRDAVRHCTVHCGASRRTKQTH